MKIEQIPLTQLKPAPYNPRKPSPSVLAGVVASIKQFGFKQPVVVNERNGGWPTKSRGLFIVGGHVRAEAAGKLGMKLVPCVRVKVNAAEEKLLNVALNRGRDFDPVGLGGMIEELTKLKVDLSPMGFLKSDLTMLLQAHEWGGEMAAVAPAPPLPLKAITKLGDLIELGRHRLLCGDAGDWTQVARLTQGDPVQLVVTDPPYNVGTTSWTVPKGKSGRVQGGPKKAPTHAPLQNDSMSAEEYAKRLIEWFGSMAKALEPGRGFYLWGGYANCGNYPPALEASGLYFAQALIWVKDPVLTRKDFMGAHEWCFYGWKSGAAHFRNKAIHNCTDVWTVKKVSQAKMVHLTEKPVELARRAILFSSRPEERVLDLFAGSGSVLIAAEQTGRTALCMELDPLYCDVIRKRWENHCAAQEKT